ncbi:DUF4974 domain-containing protein [Flavivirga amylovorans]|uniref:DUF4974 domain-containing protein n=1 Tax=Flavivirga amylovorans TaxID=870486 RepID=A0ABT8X0P1_9FLAO|nr:FecR family protein [Flavivirga amylovorans]MDO5987514.1 DUF4974 domain-containing protein [Flavivirga amylovorans]
MSKDIEKLIVKFLLKEANFDELRQLELWVSNTKNETLFLEYIKTNTFINNVMNKYDRDKAKEKILYRIGILRKSAPIYKKSWFRFTAAASILILIAAGLWFTKLGNTTEPQFIEPIIVNNQIQTGTDKATLTLESGEHIALAKGALFQTQNATSNGEEIIYNDASKSQQPTASSNITYNYLTIPRGGQFQLTLSDGTQVWLNSESRLKYPVAFNKGETRQVELVYGEAYFDISPSTNHHGADFKVYHKEQEVQVLGTEFNIKAYKDEANIYTTLVEGKVAISAANQHKTLAPTERANLDISSNIISISKVDVYNEVSWKEGVFSFEGKTLKDLMQVLSRWYDMEVQFENKDLEDLQFLGKLKKSQSIEEILSAIKNSSIINNFEINSRTIILK